MSERPTAENDVPAHEHEWEVEYLPDPMSAGGVLRSGDLVCVRCGAVASDIPPGAGCGASDHHQTMRDREHLSVCPICNLDLAHVLPPANGDAQ